MRKGCRDFLSIVNTDPHLLSELELNISWSHTEAKKELINLTTIFGYPDTLNMNQNGLANWNNIYLKDKLFYENPNIFEDILIKDTVISRTKSPLKPINFLFLTINIHIKPQHMNIINKYKNVLYDNNLLMIKTNNYLNGIFAVKVILDSLINTKINPEYLDKFIMIYHKKNNNKKNISRLISTLRNQINRYEGPYST